MTFYTSPGTQGRAGAGRFHVAVHNQDFPVLLYSVTPTPPLPVDSPAGSLCCNALACLQPPIRSEEAPCPVFRAIFLETLLHKARECKGTRISASTGSPTGTWANHRGKKGARCPGQRPAELAQRVDVSGPKGSPPPPTDLTLSRRETETELEANRPCLAPAAFFSLCLLTPTCHHQRAGPPASFLSDWEAPVVF